MHDLPMSEVEEVLGGHPGAEHLVDADGHAGPGQVALHDDEGDTRARHPHHLESLVVTGDHHDALHADAHEVFGGVAERPYRHLGEAHRRGEVAGRAGGVLDAAMDARRTEQRPGRADDADHPGPPADQRAGGRVGAVVESSDGLEDPLPRLAPDAGRPVDDPGHRLV